MSRDRQERHQLGYSFAPLPRRAITALADGRLSPDDLTILAFLYGRVNWRTLRTPRVTRTAISTAIAWEIGRNPRTADYLRKRLKRLEDKCWLTYLYDPATVSYVFTLLPEEPPRVSEVRPTLPASVSPTPGEPRTEKPSGLLEPLPAEESDPESGRTPRVSPTPGPNSPTPRPPGKPVAKRGCAAPSSETVRTPQTFRTKQNLNEERTGENLLGKTTARKASDNASEALARARAAQRAVQSAVQDEARDQTIDWPEPALPGEEGVLADFEALVNAGAARWIDDAPIESEGRR